MANKKKTSTVTPTSQVLAMLDTLNTKTKITTLHDLIITRLNPTRKFEYAAFMVSANRALLSNPKYSKLIGKVIRPSNISRGRPPLWASGLASISNLHPMPNWEASKEIVAMTIQFENLGLTDALKARDINIEKHFSNIAKFGRRNYESATVAVNAAIAIAMEERAKADTIVAEMATIREHMSRFSLLSITPPSALVEAVEQTA